MYFTFSNFFPQENRAVYKTMWKKYGRDRQTTDDSMAHACCFLDTQGYKYMLKICNNYFFPTATMVIRERALMLCFYLHCLSRLFEVCYVRKISELRKNVDFLSLYKTLRNDNFVSSV